MLRKGVEARVNDAIETRRYLGPAVWERGGVFVVGARANDSGFSLCGGISVLIWKFEDHVDGFGFRVQDLGRY